MIDCTTCAQALQIAACPTTITLGMVEDDVTDIVVRFTDRATGRTTIAEVDPAELPTVVAETPFDFAPGQSVMAEVLTLIDDGPGAPIEFYPLVNGAYGPEPVLEPTTCIVFTPVKIFDSDGDVYTAGPHTLIIES